MAAVARQQAQLLTLLAINEQTAQQHAAMAARPVDEPSDDAEPVRDNEGGQLWRHLDSSNNWCGLTNLPKHHILSIFELLLAFLPSQRGRKPTIPYLDSLAIYLIWAKMGLGLKHLAALLCVKKSKLERAIERVRKPLLACLARKWWGTRIRPTPNNSPTYPYVALLIDSTTVEICQPGGPFDEVKDYYDVKNGIYGIKKEVAVLANPPHYAMFSAPHHLGSEHDFSIHKKEYSTYIAYLTKTPHERGLLALDQDPNFAILGDSAYIGDGAETPGLRRVAIPRHSTVRLLDQPAVQELKRLRVSVECFFGRQQNLWGIVRGIYKWSRLHFDLDFDITVLLTNEHIASSSLLATDRSFHLAYLNQRMADSLKHREEWAEKQRVRRARRRAREQEELAVGAMLGGYERPTVRRRFGETLPPPPPPQPPTPTNGNYDDEVLLAGSLF